MVQKIKDRFRSLINLFHLIEAILANIQYGFPSNKIKIIGITGTKGKTTTANYIYQLLSTQYKTGLICTSGIIIDKDTYQIGAHVTTPATFELQKYIKLAVNKQLDWLVIETSSHGFNQNRLWGIKFDIGIVTNIAEDHLDYHHTWSKYALAKARLIKQLKQDGLVLLNRDDQKGFKLMREIAKNNHKKIISYGTNKTTNNYLIQTLRTSMNGIDFKLSYLKKELHYHLNTFGSFNLYNATAATITAQYLKIIDKNISKQLATMTSPPGRMEIIQKTPYTIIVDYAHNTYSLEEALKNIAAIKTKLQSRIITVFGCPGLRDKNRRKMGYISAKYSNITIITADDPRTEKVEDINKEIEKWAIKGGAKRIPHSDLKNKLNHHSHYYTTTLYRKKALEIALKLAKPNDIVYVTGMGDQHTIAVGITDLPWNDKKEILSLLNASS